MSKVFNKEIIVTSLLAVLCTALWGISTPIVKMEYKFINSESTASLFLLAGIQFIAAGILTVLFYSIKSKKFVYPGLKSMPGIMQVSFFQVILQYSGIYIGMLNTTSVKASVLKSTDVFFVLLITCFLLRQEKVTWKKIVSCVVGFAGIILVNLDGLSFDLNLSGDGLVLLGTLFYSVSVIVIKKWSLKENPIVISGYQMAIGGAVLTLIGIILRGTVDFKGVLPYALCVSLIYAVSYSVWTMLLKKNPASRVVIYSFATPIFGVLFSFIMLPEENGIPIVNLILSVALICFGIILRVTEKSNDNG